MAKYSVLIPAYNAEAYLEECVKSVVSQSGFSQEWIARNVEIIIADDGSTDDTLEICKKLAGRYKNVKYFHKENEGQFLTRQFLCLKANGEYLIAVDADDTWEPTLIEKLENALEAYPLVDMIVFGFNLWTADIKTSFECIAQLAYLKEEKAIIGKLLSTDKYNSLWSKVIRRDIALRAQCPEEWGKIKRGEDKLFTLACLKHCNRVLLIPENLYNYRIDNVSMTRKFVPDYFTDVLFVDSEVYAALKGCGHVMDDAALLWADSLIAKFNDYVYSAYQNLKRPGQWLRKYHSAQVVKDAVLLLRKSPSRKQRVKALLVQYRMFVVIYWGIKFKNKA